MANNNSCPRSPNAIFAINITVHAHSTDQAKERIREILENGMNSPAPEKAIDAKIYKDLVADVQISEPIWTGSILTEEEMLNSLD